MIPAVGTRTRLLDMPDDPDPIPSGAEGVVVRADAEQIVVDWDDGRSLNLIPGVDVYEAVPGPSRGGAAR